MAKKEISVDTLVAIESDADFIEALESISVIKFGTDNPYGKVKARVDKIKDGTQYETAARLLDIRSQTKGKAVDTCKGEKGRKVKTKKNY